VEISWSKLLGVVLMLAPVRRGSRSVPTPAPPSTSPRRSPLIAHLSVGDGPEAWGWVAATGVLWGSSYFFWRRLQAAPASA